MAQETRTFGNNDQVELYVDGAWVPAIVKGVNTAQTGVGNTYTVSPDMAGQPQFTNRPPRHYHPFKAVTVKSLRERGSSSDPDDKVDVADFTEVNRAHGNVAVGDFAHSSNVERHNKAAAEKLGYDSSDRNPSGEMPVATPAGTSENIRSDKEGNVTHGANASVELVGDVTGTNGTGAVNAAGQVPAAAPNTPVNQTPYTVEASTDPALGLGKVNVPNTGVDPAGLNMQGEEVEADTKTGNDAPVNSNTAKDKLVAGDEQDGATAAQIPVGSKDDHQANAEADDKDLSKKQKASAVENPVVPEVKAKLAKGDLKTQGTNTGFDSEAAEERAKNAEKMTSDTDPTKPTQEDADKVADVHSATGDDNPQRPATDTAAADGTVGNDETKDSKPQTVEEATQSSASGTQKSDTPATGNNKDKGDQSNENGTTSTPEQPTSNPSNPQ